MEESSKTNQEIQELDPEIMEQVSGGGAPLPTTSKYCGNCKGTTKWIYLNGGFVCGTCGQANTGAAYVYR